MPRLKYRLFAVPAAGLTVLAGPAFAKVYLSVEQAQAAMFPGASMKPDFRTLTREQAKAIEKESGVDVRNHELKIWRASTGGFFIADEVVGKHEFIPFALALNADGSVRSIEILEYREAYGGQVRDPHWQSQFTGKRPGDRLKLGKEISNVSGATLSCRHITDGVSRLLATYAALFSSQNVK